MSSPTNSSFKSSSPVRENRWKGPASTWQRLTEEERGLAASLDELRNRDLSVHLYNAFALKKQAKELKNDTGDEDEDGDDSHGFAPSKSWIAWPIEATEVPREGEQIGPDDANEIFTLKKREVTKLSKDLEDILTGVTLKYAKETFRERETAEDHDEQVENGDAEEMDIDEPEQEPLNASGEIIEIIKKPVDTSSTTTILRPEISADDERSWELLRPSVRHNLSKLDDILMALHHARKTCRQYASQADLNTDVESYSRATSIADDATDRDSPVKRPRGRPRKFQPIGEPSNIPIFEPAEDGIDDPELWRVKKTHRGRPKKVYERLEGETQHEYLTRIARIQKKPLPLFAPPIEPSTPKKEATPATASPRKSPRRPSEKPRKHRLGLRDWSEVLGSAALVGFSPEIVARATQRCANLFGENMLMRTMVEGPASQRKEDLVTEYHPGMIPDLGESDGSVSSSDDSGEEFSNLESDTEHGENDDSLPKIHALYYCPINQCQRSKDGFKTTANLQRHAKTEHELSKAELEALQIESDEEMDGAVHNDRFLKPITGKREWRGRDKANRKRSQLQRVHNGGRVSGLGDEDEDEDEDDQKENADAS